MAGVERCILSVVSSGCGRNYNIVIKGVFVATNRIVRGYMGPVVE